MGNAQQELPWGPHERQHLSITQDPGSSRCVCDAQGFHFKLKVRGSTFRNVLPSISETVCSMFKGPRWQADC